MASNSLAEKGKGEAKMDLRTLTLEDALANICILAEFAEERLAGNPLEYELEQLKTNAAGWLGEVLARKRIEDARRKLTPRPGAPGGKKAKTDFITVIPPAHDDVAEVLADAIEADLKAEAPETVAGKTAGLHQQVIHGEEAPPPVKVSGIAIGPIKDPGRFAALVTAGWDKKRLAEEFRCDVKAIEEYCRVMRYELHPGKRKRTVKPLENLSGEAI